MLIALWVDRERTAPHLPATATVLPGAPKPSGGGGYRVRVRVKVGVRVIPVLLSPPITPFKERVNEGL
jgi:hypothetical protein